MLGSPISIADKAQWLTAVQKVVDGSVNLSHPLQGPIPNFHLVCLVPYLLIYSYPLCLLASQDKMYGEPLSNQEVRMLSHKPWATFLYNTFNHCNIFSSLALW